MIKNNLKSKKNNAYVIEGITDEWCYMKWI